MPIPESQLETWSHQGAVTTSSATYRSIQTALAADSSPIKGKDYEVYLQGSYKNDTNIRGDSDVDVVVQLNDTFGRDLAALPESQKRLYQAAHSSATYLWGDFRKDVLQALRYYYGLRAVTEGDKSLKLAADRGRLAADVVPALHFRKYQYFYSLGNEGYVDGVKFLNRPDSRQVINFPKPHYENGVAKHSRTNQWYKPTVRMFKNARTHLIDDGTISEDLAPSYFLECLLYNAPDAKFGRSFEDTFVEIFNWLWEARIDGLVCQNEELPLFGTSPEQWDALKAKQLLEALKELWENW
jgi:predicted nucleotidyltransferase